MSRLTNPSALLPQPAATPPDTPQPILLRSNQPLPPLKALKNFEAAARLRSLTRAAEELHVTQGAVSQQVKLLEDYLDTPLFIRKPRGLELTGAAQAYLPVLSEAFALLQTGTNELFGNDHRVLLKIKCGSSFLQRWLMPRLKDFYRQHPGIRLRLLSAVWPSEEQVEEADIEISNGYGDWSGMQVERISHEHLVAVASPAFLARDPIKGELERLIQAPLISIIGGKENWPQWFRQQGIDTQPMPLLECDTSTAAFDAACQGLGVLLARNLTLQPLLDSGQLVQVHPFTLKATGAHYLVTPNKALSPKVIVFRDWLKSHFSQ